MTLDPMSDAPMRTCSRCGERFALKHRRGRNLGGRTEPRPTSYHKGARYCSDTCRKLASKARRAQQPSPKNGVKSQGGSYYPLSTVTCAKNSAVISRSCEGKKSGQGSPKKPVLDPRIVPDDRWPEMYRLKRTDGTLSDMVNLTRAKDALAVVRRHS